MLTSVLIAFLLVSLSQIEDVFSTLLPQAGSSSIGLVWLKDTDPEPYKIRVNSHLLVSQEKVLDPGEHLTSIDYGPMVKNLFVSSTGI
jgi:hypothetical protein